MQLDDFDYHLPPHLIAETPSLERTHSRMLVVSREAPEEPVFQQRFLHHQFKQVVDFLQPGDLLVLNDTRVIKARLQAQKKTGGKVEIFVERVLANNRCKAFLKASKAPKVGAELMLKLPGSLPEQSLELKQAPEQSVEKNTESFNVLEKIQDHYILELNSDESELDLFSCLEKYGEIPLPPYIKRAPQREDESRYQTVYAKKSGAVAAPTAGLHFTQALLAELEAKGVQIGYVTLHVGAGTFQPVRVTDIHQHEMHAEYFEVSAEVIQKITATKQSGRRVVAVGTTSVRALESAAIQDDLSRVADGSQGDSRLFIYPGFKFRVIDAMITNFHLPKSTLLMLVSAFAGREQILKAYQAAIDASYRFFSYGDAMLIGPEAMLGGIN